MTNPPEPESLTLLEAGNALEPVVVRAMRRAGWRVTPADRDEPQSVSVEAAPRADRDRPSRRHRLPAAQRAARRPPSNSSCSAAKPRPDETEDLVIEVKTRGPEAFKRWRTLGAERSHPESVAQAACYSLGLYGECRDVVIATLDTGARQWDYEVIPAARAERAWRNASGRLEALAEHHALSGPDPEALPNRDFTASDWQCQRCPYLNLCQPGEAALRQRPTPTPEPAEPVSDEAAQEALREYEQVQARLRSLDSGQARRAQDPPALAATERRNQSQAGGFGQAAHGRHGHEPPLLGRPPAAQRAARTRTAGRDRDRAGLGVPPGQLTTSPIEIDAHSNRAPHSSALPTRDAGCLV